MEQQTGYRAVLFDLDGTLLDTVQDLADSVNAVLRRHGFPEHDVQAYKYFVGDGVEELARRALPEDQRREPLMAGCVAAIREEYSQRWANNTRPYDGIPELLDALSAAGIPMAILSNKPDDSTRATVSRLLAGWRFHPVVGASASVPMKPDPGGALAIARSLSLPPEAFIYLGDTATDMKTARAAGMYAVGALWGFRTAAELAQSGAQTIIERPGQLLELLRAAGLPRP
ncbi:MAG: HAD family hydrolase [Chloroflexi bacterium]|nr:HAD family hydrolase [Chloroflexota bacterium]